MLGDNHSRYSLPTYAPCIWLEHQELIHTEPGFLDPSYLQDVFLDGVLNLMTLSCGRSSQVKAPYIMADLTERLIPNGVYVPKSPVDPELDRARSSRLHIDSISDKQRFIKLQPLPEPDAEPRALPERIFPVTVISSDGRERPTMFGMPIKQVRIAPSYGA